MQAALINPVPAWRAVVREQFRAVGLSLRREAMVVGGFLALASVWITWMSVQRPYAEGVPFTPEAGIPVAILALLVPMAVWKGEGPASRGYHRAMPVGHAAHAVTRTLSGMVWTLAAVAGYFGWLGLMCALTGGEVEYVREPYLWATPFTGGVVLYLLGSALALVTAYPWRWLGGGVVAYLFMTAMRAADGTGSVFDGVLSVVNGRYGIFTVVSGLARDAYGSDFVSHSANPGVWLLATWMWLAVAISVFLFAAYRQPER